MVSFPSPSTALRHRFERRSRRLELAREIRDSLVSLAGLLGLPVHSGQDGAIGKVADVVVRWDTDQPYPLLAGVVVRVAMHRAFVPASAVASVRQREVILTTARLDLRDFVAREGETALAGAVLDHQLVDIDGARVVRASDLYLATVAGPVRLVGVDVGFESLLRRLGPTRCRTRPTPEVVIDWATSQLRLAAGPGRRPAGPAPRRAARLRPGSWPTCWRIWAAGSAATCSPG